MREKGEREKPMREPETNECNLIKLLLYTELRGVLNREVGQLSGGELQRFAIAVVAVQKANVYMFDEPSSYLDVKQRLNAARVIRSLVSAET